MQPKAQPQVQGEGVARRTRAGRRAEAAEEDGRRGVPSGEAQLGWGGNPLFRQGTRKRETGNR